VKKGVPLGNSTKRIVDTSKVDYVVTFLASPRSIAVSGEVLSAGDGFGQAVDH
jgi:enoyl-[acyl-carrier-protein] reductase (NADH)